ncbi:putative Secreted Protein (CpLSP family), partial [Cryptosporidium felis]
MPNRIGSCIVAYCFFVFIILFAAGNETKGNGKIYTLSREKSVLWGIIKNEIRINDWVVLSSTPDKIFVVDESSKAPDIEICKGNKMQMKKNISLMCINMLSEFFKCSSRNSGYSIKVKKGVSFQEAIARLCIDVTSQFLSKRNKICSSREVSKKFESSKDRLGKPVVNKDLHGQTTRTKTKQFNKYELSKQILGILFDYKRTLVPNKHLISQIRKSKQKEVLRMINAKDLKGLANLLSNESLEDSLSFLNVLIGDKDSKESMNLTFEKIKQMRNSNYKIRGNTKESVPFGSLPTPEEEWNAIVNWIESNTRKIDLGENWLIKKNKGNKLLKFPEDFVASQGVEKVFLENCLKGIRELAYKVYIAPNESKYYKYDGNNDFGLIIQGKNQHERERSIRDACRLIFNGYFEYIGVSTKKENDEFRYKINGKLNFLLPLKHDRIFLNKLLRSFYNSINNKDREWHAIVNEARISPLVNSQDIQEEIIPYNFADAKIAEEMNLEKKESLLSESCFKAINTLRNERLPGSPDTPAYKIHIGSQNEISIAKFCKGLFERFILRHIEWLKITIKSIGNDNIKLIDMDDPYLEIPDTFLFPEDARLRENCITSLILVFEKNAQALENGYPVKVYPQMSYLGDPSKITENIVSFCESLSGKVIPRRVDNSDTNNENSKNDELAQEFKLIDLSNSVPDKNLLLNFETKIENRIDRISQESQISDVFRLENWKSHFEEISSLDSYSESLLGLYKSQFGNFLKSEDICEKRIRRLIHFIASESRENDVLWLENYLLETDRLKGDWATELQSIENLYKSTSAAERELEGYVNTIISAIRGDEKQKELPQVRKILKEWPREISNKERAYIKHKIDSLLSRQKHESNIESLRYEQLERRRDFGSKLRVQLEKIQEKPLFIDLEHCMKEGDLYPIYPESETKEEERIRNIRLSSIDNELKVFKDRFTLVNNNLNQQLKSLDSVLTKAQKDFQTAWRENFETALALQLHIRTRSLVEEYIRVSERYMLIKRVKADYEYRKGLVNEFQTDTGFENMLNRASEMIERADKEEIELEKELSELSEKKNNLASIVEEDMQNLYSQRLKTIRDSKDILKARIDQEKKLLIIEEKIFEDQLKRDMDYYKIGDISESAIFRAEQLSILYEATNWLLNFNDKLTISFESQFRDDLERLDYIIPWKNEDKIDETKNDERFNIDILKSNLRRHKYKYNDGFEPSDILNEQEMKREAGEFYNDDQSIGQIPIVAQNLLGVFKEKLKLKLNDIDEINRLLLQLNLNMVGSFQYFDFNREKAYNSFLELKNSKGASEIFAVVISHFEWEHIQLRWRILQLTKFILSEKEKRLNEITEMKSSLDNKMKEYGAIPLSRKLVPIGTITSVDLEINEMFGIKRSEGEPLEAIPSSIP